MWLLYFLLSVALFYFSSLMPAVWHRYLDPFALLLLFICQQGQVLTATLLALGFGLLLDAYAHAPLGLEASRLLIVILGVRFLQVWLNLNFVLPQMLAVGFLVLVQGLLTLGWLTLLLPGEIDPGQLWAITWRSALGTALAAPVAFQLFSWLNQHWRRWFAVH